MMTDIEITIHLPENLVKAASELGLLSSEHIEMLLRADIEAQLDAMANDPTIRRELEQIEAEFNVTEGDGFDLIGGSDHGAAGKAPHFSS